MSNDDILEMPQPLGIYAGELLERGKQYSHAFIRLVGDQTEPDLPYPTYFLLSHSLELFLKAFLAAHGVGKAELKQHPIRHSVLKLRERCEQFGFPEVENLTTLVVKIDHMNSDYDFRYPTGYRLTVPRAQDCVPVIRELERAISPLIEHIVAHANMKFARDTLHLRPAKIRWSD